MKLVAGKHEIEMKDYLTGGQHLDLKKMQLQASKMTGFNMQTQEPDISADLSVEVDIQRKALEMLVVSIDGETDGALDKVLALPGEEFEIVLEYVDSLRGKKKLTSEE